MCLNVWRGCLNTLGRSWVQIIKTYEAFQQRKDSYPVQFWCELKTDIKIKSIKISRGGKYARKGNHEVLYGIAVNSISMSIRM